MENNKQKALPDSDSYDKGLQNSFQGQTTTLTKEELDRLFQDHFVGESPSCLEGRTGTEALMPISVPSHKALELSKAYKAIKPKSAVDAASRRREEPEYDSEQLPNRADD